MTDSYYELIDDASGEAGALGEKFRATDLARGTWSAAHTARRRRCRRCWSGRWSGAPQRDDTRLSRVVIDLLGGVPAEGDLWVRSQVERGGKQVELVSAEMLAPGPDGQPRPVARASGWRLQQLDTPGLAHAPAPPLRPRSEAHDRRPQGKGVGPQLRAQPGLALADRTPAAEARENPGSCRRRTWSRARP